MKLLALLTVFLLSPLTFKAPIYQNLKLEKSQDIIKDKATYIVSKPFDKTINTFETTIVLPKDIISSEPLGVIFGNYYNSSFGYEMVISVFITIGFRVIKQKLITFLKIMISGLAKKSTSL